MSKDVLPITEDGRKSWGENTLLKFPPLREQLGFSETEEKALFDDIRMMIFVITASQSVSAEAKGRTAYKRQMLDGAATGGNALPLPLNTLPAPPATLVTPGVIGRIRAAIQRMKTQPGYTKAIGEQLQIEGSKSDGLNTETAKPMFKSSTSSGKVRLDWTKGDFDGVVIESRRGAETTFSLLDKDFKSPFEDLRPNLVAGQPEVRRYRMIYLLDDAVVGIYSDEVVITTTA
jgi:hypothetical protein